ncbi:hypothetical protein COX58_02670 [archaeon CG_4_10_14_0_2_um_filter_Archaea_38_6]|nr:MAG: hypothetical protein COS83_01650 [archaeon CG07_land_8_20_14_0_80_38_8]PIU89471.1 MAG: hypothetical protein COS64_00070 [archaeon CG06_land_8_20_14_3_00_37_11]PIX43044.1 MAG: hypothetical protein COZ55_01540 [archaeon CG_4_8_14_3_um_filter_38_5]PJA22179.1 MAG: hypothetical protein COX58_02670 [archaeon CG_4_10_14_0_2_um_filter_Archaea_38_6]
MINKLKKDLLENKRGFYATLVSICTLIICLVYYIFYNAAPLTLIAVLPIIFWISYDGNEHDTAATKGYWVWVLLLLITTAVVLIYPLF